MLARLDASAREELFRGPAASVKRLAFAAHGARSAEHPVVGMRVLAPKKG